MIGFSGLSLVLHRRTAAIVGFICLWLGTIGALHHDDIIGLLPSSNPHAQIGKSVPIAPHGPCTACEWEQLMGTGQTPSCPPILLLDVQSVPRAARIVEPVILRHFDYTSLRAPPAA